MGAKTEITWCDSTFNPWWGCEKISPGCKNCYAATFDRRVSGKENAHWGPGAPRRFFGDKHWAEPLAWNEKARLAGKRARVFCASMADVFEDHHELIEPRARLFKLIAATPSLDWLLLTKRPENIARLVSFGAARPNVWFGATVEDREHLTRLETLRQFPAVLHFVSFEPLLEDLGAVDLSGIDWAIVGGESGPGARPFNLAWARSLREQCIEQGVAFFMKQLGRVPVIDTEQWRKNPKLLNAHNKDRAPAGTVPLQFHDTKGGDWDRWPGDLRYRNFPEVRR